MVGFLRNSDGYDPLAPNVLPREAWGVSAGSTSGYVDPTNGDPALNGGPLNIIANGPPIFGANAATIGTTLTDGVSKFLNVTQVYTFVAPNVLSIATTIENISGSVQDVKFSRQVNWNMTGGPTSDPNSNTFVNYTVAPPLPPSGVIIAATYNGFESADPNDPFDYAFGPNGGIVAPGDPNMPNGGGGLQLELGSLANLATTTFTIFHAVSQNVPTTQTRDQLLNQLTALGSAYTITATSTENGLNSDGSVKSGALSAALGFAMDQASSIPAVPEPSTLASAGFAILVGLAVRFRRRHSTRLD